MDLTRARASFYAFLNIHFMQLPDASFAKTLREEAFGATLKDLQQCRDIHPEIVEGASLMQAHLEKSKTLDDKDLAEQLGVDRTRLYRGVPPRYGPPPPFEALWSGKGEKTDLLQALAGIYGESGFSLKPDIRERLDYIGIEMNYLECLVRDEMSARESGDRAEILKTLKQERAFLKDHLGQWATKYVAIALGHAETDFYRGHLHMVNGFMEQERTVLDNISCSGPPEELDGSKP